jgi:hypothetical protein
MESAGMSNLHDVQSDVPREKRLVPSAFSSKNETFLFVPSIYSRRLGVAGGFAAGLLRWD